MTKSDKVYYVMFLPFYAFLIYCTIELIKKYTSSTLDIVFAITYVTEFIVSIYFLYDL